MSGRLPFPCSLLHYFALLNKEADMAEGRQNAQLLPFTNEVFLDSRCYLWVANSPSPLRAPSSQKRAALYVKAMIESTVLKIC